ncbi:MAG: helix-turn-helix domain-containing protein [Chitinivibrionales bacterium]|nr:helix-turn-helix domain-containing protein [Chitinivibrionales bacterium]MBD3397237.1 helix-turn-helix domain-containing protein [Chitinivibrionales bacterium]
MARIGKNQLVKLQKKYKTDEAIGRLYGISRQAVHQLRDKYGIAPVADRHGDRNAEIVKLYKQGMAGTRIARKLKLSVSQTYRVLNATQGVSIRKV